MVVLVHIIQLVLVLLLLFIVDVFHNATGC